MNERRCKMMMANAWIFYIIAFIILGWAVVSKESELIYVSMFLFGVFLLSITMAYIFGTSDDGTVGLLVKGVSLVLLTPVFIATSIIDMLLSLVRKKKGDDDYYDD